jgi:hypothetical protein
MGPKVYLYTLCHNPEERRTHPVLYHISLSVSNTDCPGIESESPVPPSVVTMLGFAKWLKAIYLLRRAYLSVFPSFRPAVRPPAFLYSHTTDFCEIWYLRLLLKRVLNTPIWLISVKNRALCVRTLLRFATSTVTQEVQQRYKAIVCVYLLYRTIILPVALYGCETWSLTLREERRLRVFWE